MVIQTISIAELKEKVRKVSQLLDDPHPGLSTWRIAVHRALKRLSSYAEGYLIEADSLTALKEMSDQHR